MDEPIIGMLPYRAYDEESGLFINSSSCGFMLEVSPLSGATEETVNMLSAAFSDVMPDNSSLQVMCWASPHIGEAIDKWSNARNAAPGVYRMLAKRRSKFFADGGWKSPLPGTDHLLRDFRVFIAGSSPGPIEKNRDALSAASRKLSQAMTGIGATANALDPEEFLSIVDEWIRPLQEDRREPVVWRSIDPMHYQLSHGESSITVHPTRLIFSATHDVRCLSVHSWPES
ncbi:MAG: conjugal transfer protein TraC, partial [bacterium]|nr:conjugal transfer protein TraC [bacterium]